MKIIKKITLGLVALATMGFASCSNDLPTFNDADAFISFEGTSSSVKENCGTLEIPVTLSSLAGLSGTVDFEITPNETSGAVEGVNFTVANSSRTLSFSKEEITQYIKLNIIDLAGQFTGDLGFTITLKNATGVNMGAEKTYSVTIEDLDHPLSFMLGTYTGTGESYYNGDTEWTVQIAKDADDVSKVWITNFVPSGSSSAYPIYGTVNDDKTEIHIPVKQQLASSSSYPFVGLLGYRGDDGEEDVEDYLVGTITTDENGKAIITFANDWFASMAYTDEAGTSAAGYYNLMKPGVVLKLK